MTAATLGNIHLDYHYQQQTSRRMSGSLVAPLKPSLYNNERRFSVQTPQCISQFPSQPLHYNNQPFCPPTNGMNNFYQYPDKKTPLRSTTSLPIHASQPAMMNSTSNHLLLQRSASLKPEPAQANTESDRYKTELCRPFEETGECRYGTKCQFAHGMRELRSLHRHPKYRTTLCRTYHTTGICSYGQRCNFIHNEDERRGSLPTTLMSSRPQVLPIVTGATSTGDSPASSLTSGSPTHSPCYLDDMAFSPASSGSYEDLTEQRFFGGNSHITGDELMLNFDLQNLVL